MKTGGQILAECLQIHGVARVACVAGESYLAVLDALLDAPDIRTVTCRHESGAAFMAAAWGRLSGEPGIAFVTRGPGACNASIGVHAAMQDSAPMILFMGQVRRHERGREAFQEIDVGRVFGGLAKWTAEIDDPARIPEIVRRAFQIATSGRPGPVVIALPEDMLRERAQAPALPPYVPVQPSLAEADRAALIEAIKSVSRPLIVAGGPGWTDRACEDLAAFVSAAHIPVAAAWRRQDILDHASPCYVGDVGLGTNPKLLGRVRAADLLIVLGNRLDEITTQGYTLLEGADPAQRLVHIHPSADELGKVYAPHLAIQASVAAVAEALAGAAFSIDGRIWADWCAEGRRDFLDWTAIGPDKLKPRKGADMTAIFARLRDLLPKDAIVATDAGNFAGWARRYLRHARPGRMIAPVSGAMGYGVPAALAASLMHPDRLALGICGDGGFLMTAQELATAMHHGANPIILVCNNGMYGTIRMHQERDYPGRVSATSLTNPDFVAFAQSFGAFAARVTRAESFDSVWAEALDAGRAAVIEIAMDPAQLSVLKDG